MINRENSYKFINLGVAVMAMVIVICIAVSLTVWQDPSIILISKTYRYHRTPVFLQKRAD